MEKKTIISTDTLAQQIKKRRINNAIFRLIIFLATSVGIVFLGVLMYRILSQGLPYLNWKFITSLPSRFPGKAGIFPALVGSAYTIGLTTLIAFPLGVGTAIYLEEYASKKSKFVHLLEVNIANLAGIPSIVYGMLGLAVFVKLFAFERSVLSGALTLALLILPVIIVSSQEALKSVPRDLKQGSYALGATKWQTITGVVLPYAMPGILTGTILAVSRAMGEAAPLIMVGAAGYVAFLPESIFDAFSVLPIQIFNWSSRPQAEFQNIAAAGIIVLMVVLLSMNAIAIILRNRYQSRLK